MAETVSVIIPAFNAASYVERAVKSALAQTHQPLEILVVDDGSSDRTVDIVAAMPPPVRLIRKQNGGPATARNLGARQAKGDWLALLDADDWWFPDKLQFQLAQSTNQQCGLIHCLPDHRNDDVPPRLTFEHMWRRNWIINSSVMIRRAAFEALGGFNEASELISVEDYNLWIRVAASEWQIATCQKVLVHYTRGIGISSNSDRFMLASLYNIEDIGRRLSLPSEMIREKQTETIFAFGRKALFERDMPAARRLFWRAFRHQWSARHALHVVVASMPKPVLDLRRNAARLFHDPDPSSAPVTDAAVASTTICIAGSPFAAQSLPEPGTASIFNPAFQVAIPHTILPRPVLVTTIDAEEDFDWNRPFSRTSTDVTSMRSQHLAHRVFERYGVVPTYMVDHPVASQDEGRAPLKELLKGGHCEIGAQLHPWVTPPFIEHVSQRNSYHGNLPAALEFAKIEALTMEVEAAFGIRPPIFRAGRYGAGPNTGNILRHFSYQADSSVVPCWNFSHQGGAGLPDDDRASILDRP